MGLLEAALWALLDRALGPLEPERHVTTLELDSVNQDSQTSGMLRLVEPVTIERPKPAFGPMAGYRPDAPPGEWEHRSGDCDVHGVNLPFARRYRGAGPYYCCACAMGEAKPPALTPLGQAWLDAIRQREKAVEYLGWAD